MTAKSLRSAVDSKRREVSADNLSMSIGELLNLYKDGELDIHPAFQRVFRWFPDQKSRLIESLLLGIPLPPIYVATNEQGTWEVVDGVQRLSSIFEFMGELKGPRKDNPDELEIKPEIRLEATKHLPELDRVSYSTMDTALKLEFKRTRLDVKVLARTSSASATGKFDLFERLNTYGQPLTPQELRNCVLVSLNSNMFRWLEQLAGYEPFRLVTLLSDSQLQERYDMDLVLRFLVLRDANPSALGDVHEYLRDRMEEIALAPDFDFSGQQQRFNEVFSFLAESVGPNAFRSWNKAKGEFRGGFTLAAYEGIALTLGKHWPEVKKLADRFDAVEFVRSVWSQAEYNKSFSGLRARERMVRVLPAAERVLKAMLKALGPPKRTPARRATGREASAAK